MGIPWKVVGAAVVIFSAGVISGSVATRLYHNYTQPTPARLPPGGPPPPWVGQRMDFLRYMGEALGLSPEQRERIDKLIKDSQQRTRQLWEPLAPKFQAEMERLKAAVDAELTPEQRQKATELHKRRLNRPWGERSPGRWPEGQGPRRRGPDRPGEGGPPPGMSPGPSPSFPADRPLGAPPGPPSGSTGGVHGGGAPDADAAPPQPPKP